MLPRLGSSKLVTRWIVIVLAASVLGMLDGGWLASWTGLAPARIWRGEVWRLVTWIFVEPAPMGIVFTCASIYKFGGELAARWGDRRLRRFMFELLLAGSIVTSLGALVSDHAWWMERHGAWALCEALVIAWARQFPNAVLRVYYVLELSGRQLVGITVGVTILIALASSPFVMAPELVACLGAALYPKRLLHR